jgi:two-component system NtrC family response regulator
MIDILDTVRKVAATSATVMIYGESGTGKELIARAVHNLSERASRPFVSVSAGALPETLLESELFGYEKGAFTGAMNAKPGRFEMANGGTLFLDEIGELTLPVQVKLLRFLQEREFERVGGERTLKADVRIISATHQDLEARVKEGSFREDLLYRINVVTMTIPPLRERREDISVLIDCFINRFAGENRKKVEGVSREARDLLITYDYPGNVRELENIIERAVVISRSPVLSREDLPFPEVPCEAESGHEPEEGSLRDALETLERQMVRDALEKAGFNQSQAAKLLGLNERMLRYKLKKYGLK